MSPRHVTLPLCLALAACVQDASPSERYAFVGSWDCGVETFTFTNTTYNDGSDTYRMQTVSREGRNFTLRFASGYTIALAAVTDTGMTWVSGASGDQFNCGRVN